MIDVERERRLRQQIEAADNAYYDNDKPIMSDNAYDLLKRSYEAEFGSLDYVPGNVKEGFEQYTHPVQLLSLNKLYDDDPDIETKLRNILKKFGTTCVQPKIDGLTVAAYPQKDGSYKFVTRGKGGITGEVLPAFISQYTGKGKVKGNFAVRGEVFLTKKNFETVQQLQKQNGEELFSNPRNAAAGILRNKEKSPYIDYLSYVVYDIPGSHNSIEQTLMLLSQTCFPLIENHLLKGKDTILVLRNYYHKLSEQNIPVDGLVLKAYSLEDSYYKLGQTQHHPNNAIAWKCAANVYETAIKDVTWQVGRDKITPVAELDPVEIQGTLVSRATLHNLGFFKKLNLRYGDIISICKSGEVIPKVLAVTEHSENNFIMAPVICPCCKKRLEIVSGNSTAELKCNNDSCAERLVQTIAYLAGKDVLNINGLSENTARKIVELFGTSNGELMIFDLTVRDILKIPGFAQKSAEKLYSNLLKVLQTPISIPVLFKACCVTGISGAVGVALKKKFKTLDNIIIALQDYNILKKTEGIGVRIANVLISEEFKRKFHAVLELFDIEKETADDFTSSQTLANTVWVVTGKLPISRVKVEELIKANGGTVSGAVSTATDYLLTADVTSKSTKSRKAQELNVKIVNYDYLLSVIKQNNKEEGKQ